MRTVITGIIIISILTLAATIGTIVVGTSSFEGIVVEKPYETGLAWDETRRQKAELGWSVAALGAPFRKGRNELLIEAIDKTGVRLSEAVVRVTISRPATRKYDRTYQTVQETDGRYHADVELPLHGNWDVFVDVSRNNDRAVFSQTISAEQSVSGASVVPPITENKTYCDIQLGPCIRETEDGTTVKFDIKPRPVRAMAELEFIVTLTRGGTPLDGASVALELSMPGMFMGENRPALKQADPGRFEGKGVIIRCPSGEKTWQAAVTVARGGKTAAVDFLFEVN
jgi:nitrogen fixation protein FixH